MKQELLPVRLRNSLQYFFDGAEAERKSSIFEDNMLE